VVRDPLAVGREASILLTVFRVPKWRRAARTVVFDLQQPDVRARFGGVFLEGKDGPVG
jgi:hypothetical protein